MFISDSELISAADVCRDAGRFLSAASAGQRFVVLNDDAPTAAIIGMDDLRRFDALQRGVDPTEADAVDAAGVDYRSLLRPDDPDVTPIGVYADGTVATLTIRSHHSIIGREHSGREDLLSSAILGAAISNPPARLNFVFVTGRPMTGLPSRLTDLAHVVAEETDLCDPMALTRFREQIRGEVQSRRELLQRHRARSFAELRRTQGDQLEATELVVVIDDTTELLQTSWEFRDLRDLLGQIAVLEDALGLYLWLASPTPLPHPVMDLIPSRVALQVLSTSHSREVIGVSDAAQISTRGSGYVKASNADKPRRFQVVPPDDLDHLVAGIAPTVGRNPFTADAGIVGRSRWAADLPRSLAITELVSRWEAEGGRRDRACVPIGLVDDPAGHRHRVLSLDFANNPGIVTIAGGNPDHVTAAIATIIAAAYDTNTPETLQFIYLGPAYHTAAFPEFLLSNISELISWGSPERVDAAVETLVQRLTTGAPGARHVVLVLDGCTPWLRDGPANFNRIQEIARRGHAAGVHLVMATSTYDYRISSLEPLVSEAIELRLSERSMTQFDRTAAKLVPDDPRRGLTKHGQLLLATS